MVAGQRDMLWGRSYCGSTCHGLATLGGFMETQEPLFPASSTPVDNQVTGQSFPPEQTFRFLAHEVEGWGCQAGTDRPWAAGSSEGAEP